MSRFWPALSGARHKFANGYRSSNVVLRFNENGLELARAKPRRHLPIWHIIFFVYLALLIRLVIMADMGPAGYSHRIAQLKEGVWIERVAASVMQMDPVSQALAGRIRSGVETLNNDVFGREVWDG